eukprot:CAMPEP_0205852680 /NCGR_PEP_ID=MMETSP1083-20121108/1146_1 /ASSEMBLY_ACC=CAM_ASM_000430 /TAXON_ID=97485 /ORGANISM="Prymnesium parvum, Strain Texoma1" /LENGTH=121 /DNA_ID=CAMNT_0053213895 /DNA_START=650 /DNA_END=1013 /DNA_ORIENTATION=-
MATASSRGVQQVTLGAYNTLGCEAAGALWGESTYVTGLRDPLHAELFKDFNDSPFVVPSDISVPVLSNGSRFRLMQQQVKKSSSITTSAAPMTSARFVCVHSTVSQAVTTEDSSMTKMLGA